MTLGLGHYNGVFRHDLQTKFFTGNVEQAHIFAGLLRDPGNGNRYKKILLLAAQPGTFCFPRNV